MKHLKTFETFTSKPAVNEEAEGKMYKQRLEDIIANAQKFLEMLGDDEEMEAWVQDKIVIADHNLDAIVGYYQSEKSDEPQEQPVPSAGKAKMIVDKK
jgi:hypothetical protein